MIAAITYKRMVKCSVFESEAGAKCEKVGARQEEGRHLF